MNNVLTLRHPILINGKEVKELTYDTSAITPAMFCEAEMRKMVVSGRQPSTNTMEFDHALHMYLGMYAVVAVNPEIDIADLERVKGFDMIMLGKIGQNFTLAGGGAASEENSSDDSSETTQESSTSQSEN